MKLKRILLAVLILFVCLDVSLLADERFNLFDGNLIKSVECFKSDSRSFLVSMVAKNKVSAGDPINLSPAAFSVVPEDLLKLRKCYDDVSFNAVFDEEKKDWLVTIKAPVSPGSSARKSIELWWADGRLIPESELENKDKYWKLVYPYRKMKDPALMSAEEIENIRKFSSRENRQNGSGTPMFFYDFLYSARSQIIIEEHIVQTTFLGKKTKIHERIKDKLKNVETKIYAALEDENKAGNSSELKDFLANLKSADAYNWRVIEGTGRKSFHSYGISIDILPVRLGGKAIFWSWTKDKDPQNWMLTPVEKRWNPPQKVIDAFEEEGFIWGGNWVIFDNMHFEYHPELL